MKLNFNDIRYIVNEAAKRIIEAQGDSSMVTEDFSIDINDLDIPSFLEDEVEALSGGEIHMRCQFTYSAGQSGYGVEPIPERYVLHEVFPGDNSHLQGSMSPDLFDALIESAESYIWKYSEEFEEEMLNDVNSYQQYSRDFDNDMRRKERY